MKSAVIYFSNSGKTKNIADKIQKKFDADVYPVEPKKAYGGYISAVIRVAGEKARKKEPGFKTEVSDFSSYDVIFVGFPVWYGSLPSFFKEYLKKADLSGKRVIPFVTAGANGKERSFADLKELLKESEITDYFFTSNTQAGDVEAWLNGIK